MGGKDFLACKPSSLIRSRYLVVRGGCKYLVVRDGCKFKMNWSHDRAGDIIFFFLLDLSNRKTSAGLIRPCLKKKKNVNPLYLRGNKVIQKHKASL